MSRMVSGLNAHQATVRLRSAAERIAVPTSLPLRLVGPVQSRARRAPFVAVLLTVLSVGLVGLILMSTALQSQSFAISSLQEQNQALQVQQQQLEREVEVLEAPAHIASQALTLGMVPNTNPAFLRLTDGKVVGDPEPAESGSNVKRVDR
ncbi:hypothetical protein [Aeromicrobium sp. Root495]|uniref:hypothetical protein n=1 Tax=Aeromicrobium sp. Root495 TaxID=1736550 RepID=UPI0006FD4809|nr:hypothetical protein [Aeromicrobium sp. Root495]RYJ06052.1 MAG: septum formation initiator family protein [Actinomycetales bacterium]